MRYSTFDFSEALKRLKAGKTLSRVEWYHGITVSKSTVANILQVQRTKICQTGQLSTWQCSWNSLFAEDWYEVSSEGQTMQF